MPEHDGDMPTAIPDLVNNARASFVRQIELYSDEGAHPMAVAAFNNAIQELVSTIEVVIGALVDTSVDNRRNRKMVEHEAGQRRLLALDLAKARKENRRLRAQVVEQIETVARLQRIAGEAASIRKTHEG